MAGSRLAGADPGAGPLPGRGRAVPVARRDPAHLRLRHHGFGQDRAHFRSRRSDPPARRALHCLRQDGQLHAGLFRPRARCTSESAGCARPALVAVLRGKKLQRLRHHGRRADPAAEGHRGPVLGHRRAAAFRPRRRGAVAQGRDEQPRARGAPAEDGSDGAGKSHGRHRGPIHRGREEPQDRLVRTRDAHGQHRHNGGPGGTAGNRSRSGTGYPGTRKTVSCS